MLLYISMLRHCGYFIRQKKSTNQLALDIECHYHSHEVNRELSIILNSPLTYFGISYVSKNIHVLYICTLKRKSVSCHRILSQLEEAEK